MKRKKSRKKWNREGREEYDEAEQRAKLRREVVSLINGGKISKAMQRITSKGEDPNILAMLRSKYPDRGRAMPDRVTRGQCVDNLAGLRDSILRGISGDWGYEGRVSYCHGPANGG